MRVLRHFSEVRITLAASSEPILQMDGEFIVPEPFRPYDEVDLHLIVKKGEGPLVMEAAEAGALALVELKK